MDTQMCALFAQPLTLLSDLNICSWQTVNGSQRIFFVWTWTMTSSGLRTRAINLKQWNGLTYRSYAILSWNPRETPLHLTRVTPSPQVTKGSLLTTSIPINTKIQLICLPAVAMLATPPKTTDNCRTSWAALQMLLLLWHLSSWIKTQRRWRISLTE
uniref:Small 1 n=1 Tax=Theiler's encephalomyelitis virus TaxID=12124 RepID=Q89790_9PICO|nr:small 1 [Theiler's encephalomyelitis virus]AAA93175.1 small 1 [Theiler's encephalomyelitis virus]